MPIKAVHRHVDAAQLGDDIRAGGKLRHIAFPLREYLLALALIGADAEWATEMIEDDFRFGVDAGKLRQFRYLVVEEPGIKGKPMRIEPRKTFAETGEAEQALWRAGV